MPYADYSSIHRAIAEAPDNKGPCYILTDGTAIKIGAGDPYRRVDELKTGNPRPLTVLMVADGYKAAETAIQRLPGIWKHSLWVKHDGRVGRDWFAMVALTAAEEAFRAIGGKQVCD